MAILNEPIPATIAASIINLLARQAQACATERGWYDRDYTLAELLRLAVSELSECLEADRQGNPPSEKIPPHSQIEEELADALIRLLNLAHHHKIDIGAAVLAKMA